MLLCINSYTMMQVHGLRCSFAISTVMARRVILRRTACCKRTAVAVLCNNFGLFVFHIFHLQEKIIRKEIYLRFIYSYRLENIYNFSMCNSSIQNLSDRCLQSNILSTRSRNFDQTHFNSLKKCELISMLFCLWRWHC